MTDLAVTILPETTGDALAIERLHERTFGPGRFARSAYRVREHAPHLLALSFTARIGTLLVGSVRLSPIRIGETPALLLGPLTIEPPFRRRGIGAKMLERSLTEARRAGHRLVVLVGDEVLLRAGRVQAHSETASRDARPGRSSASPGRGAGGWRVPRSYRLDPPGLGGQRIVSKSILSSLTRGA